MAFEGLRTTSKTHSARMAGFYLSIVAFVGVWLMIFNTNLIRLFTVWFDNSLVDIHVVHNVTFISLIWVFGLAMLVQLYRPEQRITTMQMALLLPIIGLTDIIPQLVLGLFEPMILVFFAPVFIAAALHPARTTLFSRERLSRDSLNWPLLSLVVIALVPVSLYAIGQLNLQMTLNDEHAAVAHYSGMAMYSVLIVVYAALASLERQSGRAAAFAAAFLALVLAAVSTLHPAASAIGPLWSGAAVLWGLSVVGVCERSIRRTNVPQSKTDLGPSNPSS